MEQTGVAGGEPLSNLKLIFEIGIVTRSVLIVFNSHSNKCHIGPPFFLAANM